MIIPDLTPSFTYIFNKKILHLPQPEHKLNSSIHRGILAHYIADRAFHSSEIFIETCRFGTKEFVEVGLDRNIYRLSVVSHLIVEMLIDAQIIRNQGASYPQKLYADIDVVQEHNLMDYFKMIQATEAGHSFFVKLQQFKSKKHLVLLTDTANIVEALSKIFARSISKRIDEEHKPMFLEAINNIDVKVRSCWEELLNLNLPNE